MTQKPMLLRYPTGVVPQPTNCCPEVKTEVVQDCCPPQGISPHDRPIPREEVDPCVDAKPVTICGVIDSLPVEPVCSPLSIPYVDCDGATKTATGTTCDLIQVVPHPDAVMKVQICNSSDRELIKRCDPVTGDTVLIQYDVTTVPPTVLGATNLSTGTAYTGSLTALESCGSGVVEVEQELFCDNGTTFIRWYVIDETGKPTGVYYDTDLEGQPYTVSNQTATYYKNDVELTDPAAITAAQAAIATGTTVLCLPPEPNATCYSVPEQVTESKFVTKFTRRSEGATTPQYIARIQIRYTNSGPYCQLLNFAPNALMYWTGTSFVDPAVLKAQLDVRGILSAVRQCEPRIDDWSLTIENNELVARFWSTENDYTVQSFFFEVSFSGRADGDIYGTVQYGSSQDTFTRTVNAIYRVVELQGVVKGECKGVECLQSISDATGDDLSTLFPGTTFSFTKPECCVVRVTTDIGSFTIRKNVTSFVTQEFKCPFSVTGIEILSGNCSLSDVHIISNSSVGV